MVLLVLFLSELHSRVITIRGGLCGAARHSVVSSRLHVCCGLSGAVGRATRCALGRLWGFAHVVPRAQAPETVVLTLTTTSAPPVVVGSPSTVRSCCRLKKRRLTALCRPL